MKGSAEYLIDLSAQFVQELIQVSIRKAKLPVFDIEELKMFCILEHFLSRLDIICY